MLSAAQRDIYCGSLCFELQHTQCWQLPSNYRKPALRLCLQKTRQCIPFFLSAFCLVREWHNKIWMRNMDSAPLLCLCAVQVVCLKTIRLLTVVPSWDAEGQMVCSQQVITANMVIHWQPHKWAPRTTPRMLLWYRCLAVEELWWCSNKYFSIQFAEKTFFIHFSGASMAQISGQKLFDRRHYVNNLKRRSDPAPVLIHHLPKEPSYFHTPTGWGFHLHAFIEFIILKGLGCYL